MQQKSGNEYQVSNDIKQSMSKVKIILITILCLQATDLICQVKLPKLISDGVVLQRDTELKIWGWASSGETIQLIFEGNEYETRADSEGNWLIHLPPQNAGGPYEMTFNAQNQITISNVLFGDVWVSSGQSNMELTMEVIREKYNDVIVNSENEHIRQFTVPQKYDFKTEHKDFDSGSWKSADPNSILDFSAVAYFFAKELYEQYQIPIGLINASLGGSPVESWMSEDILTKFPSAYGELQKFKNDSLIISIEESDRNRADAWYDELNQKDEGLAAKPQWNQVNVNDNDWDRMDIPGYWSGSTADNINGVLWFRKHLDLPLSMAGKPAKLWLGRIVDQDFAYINGEFVGTTGYQYPPRKYTVNAGILKEGVNILAIRVINSSGKGGFVLDKPYYIAVGNDTIDLKGSWKYKQGIEMPPLESPTFIRWKPAGLYNGMIAPLLNFSIKGVIWYQGESNTWSPPLYAETFPAMISDWRLKWDQGDFPFLYVQLANFMEETDTPVESNWAGLRQVQLNTLKVPGTGMAVAIDLGEWNDIHPENKEDVAKRLALQARRLAYNETDIFASSPAPADFDFGETKVLISFDDVGNGLVTQGGGPLQHFAISGDGINFVWAKAEIEGNMVTVWNEEIRNPVVVRYAWADNPASANLYTKDGLPASPFEIRKSD